jgi:hypothetical protein
VSARRLQSLIIAAVALHSLVLGTAMLARPAQTLQLAGWQYEGPSFFPAQSGLFLLILGGAYLAAIWHHSFAWFLVASKAAAVAFLLAEYATGNGPPSLLPAALLDGLMGLAVAAVVVWNARRSGVALH